MQADRNFVYRDKETWKNEKQKIIIKENKVMKKMQNFYFITNFLEI